MIGSELQETKPLRDICRIVRHQGPAVAVAVQCGTGQGTGEASRIFLTMATAYANRRSSTALTHQEMGEKPPRAIERWGRAWEGIGHLEGWWEVRRIR